jgi:Flp pilus assembly protein TadB
MLSDAEERRLLEIEMLLRECDPDFVRRFDARGRRALRWRLPVLVVVAAAVAWVVTAVAVESLIAAVAGLVMLSVAVGVVLRYRAARRRDAVG